MCVSLPLVPSTPLGLENQILPDKYLSSSSQLNNSTGPYLARLKEQRDSKAWCSTGPNEWLEVFLGKQYTLTHVALQSIGGGVDVSELKVQYEKTKDGTNWTKYSKEIDGKEISKVCLLFLLQGLKIFYCRLKRPPIICHGATGQPRSTAGHKTSYCRLLSLHAGSRVSVSPEKLFFSPSCLCFSIFCCFFPLFCFSFFLLFEGKYMGSFEIVTGLI